MIFSSIDECLQFATEIIDGLNRCEAFRPHLLITPKQSRVGGEGNGRKGYGGNKKKKKRQGENINRSYWLLRGAVVLLGDNAKRELWRKKEKRQEELEKETTKQEENIDKTNSLLGGKLGQMPRL